MAWCCEECKHYGWFYSKCKMWDCKVGAKEKHICFQPLNGNTNDIPMKCRTCPYWKYIEFPFLCDFKKEEP